MLGFLDYNWIVILLMILATWRVVHFLVYESGPWDLAQRFREKIGISHYEDGALTGARDSFLAQLFSCPLCLSFWIGAAIVVLQYYLPILVYILGVIGGATLLFSAIKSNGD